MNFFLKPNSTGWTKFVSIIGFIVFMLIKHRGVLRGIHIAFAVCVGLTINPRLVKWLINIIIDLF